MPTPIYNCLLYSRVSTFVCQLSGRPVYSFFLESYFNLINYLFINVECCCLSVRMCIAYSFHHISLAYFLTINIESRFIKMSWCTRLHHFFFAFSIRNVFLDKRVRYIHPMQLIVGFSLLPSYNQG